MCVVHAYVIHEVFNIYLDLNIFQKGALKMSLYMGYPCGHDILRLSNYNRANGVDVCACVWQPTPRTAYVTVTKIASYVSVSILMNR